MLECPVTEAYKWRAPCYTHQDRNIAIIGGLKDFCVVSFLKGVLLSDSAGILVPPGENSRSARLVKFTDVSQIAALKGTLKDYVQEAIEAEKAGLKVEFPKDDLEYPQELTDKLSEDPDLKAAFHALTPGRQRGYILHFSQPVQSSTRSSRIEKSTPRILAGKGMHDR